ncbi:MAG: LacI family DNA-binding transcriptional regulator [Anaerolineales bacterium]|nr:LacI family DNA-binding transcriptional regulator [Anaerolineales bacterium]
MRTKDTSPSTTIRDVAKHAQVSIATVSRVINDSTGVREETREKVWATIEELNYTPNSLARQLSIGRTLTIGIIQPYFTLPSYIERLRGVQHILASSEYDLVIFNVDYPEQKNAYFRDLSRKMRVDGMLIVSLPPTNEQADNFSASHIPTVLIDSEHPQLCSIVADDFKGGSIATRHLVELGHRKIAFLSDYLDTPFHPAMKLRYLGYCEVLAQYEIPLCSEYVIEGSRGRINARTMAKKLLALDDPPTAIFASSDTQALGILDVAQEIGIKVPERLSVIGYDNIPDAVYNNLSTIDQNLYDSGVKGAQMLLNLLNGTIKPPSKQKVAVNLLRRNTTAPPPVY